MWPWSRSLYYSIIHGLCIQPDAHFSHIWWNFITRVNILCVVCQSGHMTKDDLWSCDWQSGMWLVMCDNCTMTLWPSTCFLPKVCNFYWSLGLINIIMSLHSGWLSNNITIKWLIYIYSCHLAHKQNQYSSNSLQMNKSDISMYVNALHF